MFQDATLLQWRTVQRNVELLAELEGVPKAETPQRATENIELVGLAGFEDKYPKQLSGGMKMRASLARTLVLDPKVFLFDEPFGAVDEITRERLNDEVISLFERKRFAGLFITHSISEAVFLSTRVLVMSARPGTIVGEFDVPFAYPREPDCASSRSSPNSAARSPTHSEVHTHERRDRQRQTLEPSTPHSTAIPRYIGDIARPASRRHVRSSHALVGPLVVFVLFLAFWEYMHRDGMRRFFDKPGFLLPSPVTVIDQAFLDSRACASRCSTASWWTTYAAFVGLAITVVLGMTLAVLMAQAGWAERSIYPYLVALQALPVLAIVPIIYSVFGGGIGRASSCA